MAEDSEWDRLLAAERRLQRILPAAVLVGGTAAALHLRHRISIDGDHVLTDLSERFDEVLAALEAEPGWETHRTRRPVLILGQLDGVMTGVRQLRRSRPLDVEMIADLRAPTLAETARIKCWLLVDRNTTRDYVDAVALLEALPDPEVAPMLAPFDEIYAAVSGGGSRTVELVERLRAADPDDLRETDLATYKGIIAPWNDWSYVTSCGRGWAGRIARLVLESSDPDVDGAPPDPPAT